MSNARDRWTPEMARDWYAAQPWLAGCNFIPSNAINQLEMWQEETFDLETIGRELGWAGGIGFNVVRVFLHDLLWEQDETGFVERIERFLEAASRYGIATMFVLFDGVWDPFPGLGPQRAPRPHVHNSGWVQSPGAEILSDAKRHDGLQGYVSGVVGAFRDDDRVLAWDLFNEPDSPNPAYGDREPPDKDRNAISLLGKAFGWMRKAGATQPLTAGVWQGQVSGEGMSEINRLMLAESDVISFHSYMDAERVAGRISELEEHGRPILLTEYMSRNSGSTFETVLPVVKQRKAAAFNWGFVSGKTQTIYPWDSWARKYEDEPEVWFHDVLRADGTPYRDAEVALIRRLTDGS